VTQQVLLIAVEPAGGGYTASIVGLKGTSVCADTVGDAIRAAADVYEGISDTLIGLDIDLAGSSR
jgi:hypothetical protein